MTSFKIEKDRFLLNNKEFKLISGALHYFRIPREYWIDRLEKLKGIGCNTVETYLPWNLHEPEPGVFDFSERLDVVSFIKEAERLGLLVIIRPTPYICGEFEFGGLPWWLLKDRSMRLRSTYQGYCSAIDRYYDELIPMLSTLQITHGGPVIACQIENEYGSYGNNVNYLNFLREGLTSRGINIPLFTSDGPWGNSLENGSVPGILKTANFGSKGIEHFKKLKGIQPDKPLVCMEFWMGWFDAWGDEEHHTRTAGDAADALSEILGEGHVNLYMFHGGTNFGFTSGANYYDEYKPDVTSYDYDAPLSEHGGYTEKYYSFQKVISEFQSIPEINLSTKISCFAPGLLKVAKRVSLYTMHDSHFETGSKERTYCMEDLNQGYGYIQYRIRLKKSGEENKLTLHKCADRAIVYENGKLIDSRLNETMSEPILLDLKEDMNIIDILVENQGRVNFGHRINEQRKGIDGAILINGSEISPVEHIQMPFDQLPKILWDRKMIDQTAGFHKFELVITIEDGEYKDTFLDMSGWGKGIVFINGKNLGRFWSIGPQMTLYVPGPFLCDGKNEFVIFETEGVYKDEITLVDKPVL